MFNVFFSSDFLSYFHTKDANHSFSRFRLTPVLVLALSAATRASNKLSRRFQNRPRRLFSIVY